jgi:uncharacterized protein (UPF0216 family)
MGGVASEKSAEPLRKESNMAKKRTRSKLKAGLKDRRFFGRPLLLEGEDALDYQELLARISETIAPKDVIEEIFVDDIVCSQWEILRLRRLEMALIRSIASDALQEFLSREVDSEMYREELEGHIAENLEAHGDHTEASAQELARQYLDDETEAVEQVEKFFGAAGIEESELRAIAMSEKVQELIQAYARHEPEVIRTLNDLLAAHGLTVDDLLGRRLAQKYEYLANIERIAHLITITEARRSAALREIDLHRTTVMRGVRQDVSQLEAREYPALELKAVTAKNVA